MSIREIDYTAPAVAFWSRRAGMVGGRGSLRTQRFSSLSAAVRFLVEDKAERRFSYTIETDDANYSGPEIDRLYRQADFPQSSPN